MLDLLKLRYKHGRQVIPDIRNTKLMDTHRGFPVINENGEKDSFKDCKDVCPTNAIGINPLSIDLGKCTFCGECERACDGKLIKFTNESKLGSTTRNKLIVTSGTTFEDYKSNAIEVRKEIHKMFGRSLKLRQVSAAGCNGCEMELAASSNVNFDIGRFGIDFVASPRHSDGLVITGPISENMAPALMDAYKSISEPKIVIAVGACAISGGIFQESTNLNRAFFDEVKIDLYIPGCPPHPIIFINSLLDFLGRK
jgi:Ni,Fe-hydrogenase III small subunit/NAD-dependent dihydropyrimidine dehydrogenase PreA subunit